MSLLNHNKNIIIALCGLKRCGKDTLTEYVCNTYNFKHMKISSKLKDIIKILFDFTPEQIEGNTKETIDSRWDITPRNAMQFVGTDVFQFKIQDLMPSVGRKFWIRSFLKDVPQNQNIIISDMRFLHEYEELLKYTSDNNFRFMVIKIIRNINNLEEKDNHISEIEYLDIPCNYIFENNGSIQDLCVKFDDIVSQNETI